MLGKLTTIYSWSYVSIIETSVVLLCTRHVLQHTYSTQYMQMFKLQIKLSYAITITYLNYCKITGTNIYTLKM